MWRLIGLFLKRTIEAGQAIEAYLESYRGNGVILMIRSHQQFLSCFYSLFIHEGIEGLITLLIDDHREHLGADLQRSA